MIHFDSDYMEGCHPNILTRLKEINYEKNTGYGTDVYSNSAKCKILKSCGLDNGEVYFLVGGTQTNTTVISSVLKNYEGVISPSSGHISIHEAGAIEFSGHKVIELPSVNGKLSADVLENYLDKFHNDGNREHMVYPAMVYISFPTEYGTLYTSDELSAIYSICKFYNIPLFVDGARLGYGIMAENNNVSLEFLAHNCDIFYIGGTKVGAMFGEAVVLTKRGMIPHFFTMIKQQGALLAKGFITGIQFDTLFTDNLYFKIAKNAITQANKIKSALVSKGYKLYIDSPTNQIFVILNNNKLNELSKNISFSFWEKYDDNSTVVRFATSWATSDEDTEKLCQLL